MYMDKKTKLEIKLELTMEHLDILNNDARRLMEALEKAAKKGTYGLKESQTLCNSLENYSSLLMMITQSAQQQQAQLLFARKE